jgi:hypothetical protein
VPVINDDGLRPSAQQVEGQLELETRFGTNGFCLQKEREPAQAYESVGRLGEFGPDSDSLHDRKIVAARLARAIGRGHDVIYHGTRAPEKVLRSGKLIPHGGGVSFSRSPEVAAYFAYLVAPERDGYLPALLVLNRSSLRQVYRLEPTRYAQDWDRDEEEEIVRRQINFRRHLLGLVRESDVSKVLGPRTNKFVPAGWSPSKWMAFQREASRAGKRFVRERRARVRDFIVKERERTGMENARSTVTPDVKSVPDRGLKEHEIAQRSAAEPVTTHANFSKDTNPIDDRRINTTAPAQLGRKSARNCDSKLGTSL